MGAWSHESFGNDTACDWVGDLEEGDDLAPVEAAFDAVLEAGEDDVDANDACIAIAAAEVVARLRGNFGVRDPYSEGVDAWVERVKLEPSADLVDKAISALERILGESSELAELWDEGEGGEEWREAVADLQKRVGS